MAHDEITSKNLEFVNRLNLNYPAMAKKPKKTVNFNILKRMSESSLLLDNQSNTNSSLATSKQLTDPSIKNLSYKSILKNRIPIYNTCHIVNHQQKQQDKRYKTEIKRDSIDLDRTPPNTLQENKSNNNGHSSIFLNEIKATIDRIESNASEEKMPMENAMQTKVVESFGFKLNQNFAVNAGGGIPGLQNVVIEKENLRSDVNGLKDICNKPHSKSLNYRIHRRSIVNF